METVPVAKVKSSVPRGFTRFYALYLIRENPMTGKEIIDETKRRSEGVWIPSPGLIYPLLGRLLRDGLIKENGQGRFIITPAGIKALEQHSKLQSQLEKQFSLVTKLGFSILTAGKILTEESIDRILYVTEKVKESVSEGSRDLQRRFYVGYRAFLESELEKLRSEHLGETKPEEAEGEPEPTL